MWRKDGKDIMGQFYALSDIQVTRRSFAWDINDFSHLQVNKKHSVSINSMSKNVLITLDLFFSGGQYSEETINITVCFSDPTIEFLTFNYFLMDAEGQRVDCGKQEILSDQFKKETTFALPLSKPK
ncbi:TD and POZ domain-containing protein 5 [Caerostris extrusa]|uniref:TD and POZ domain-containing protein 5 n=1 Tax=Caerostris extrusa TaxID=172846 RepID=A0AAV4RPF2_CAEEX|nr:TD and POZ domain-containing protein 5 [Caerostris extrusa]